ncbi:membrane-associated transporter protein-like [Styela clava]
MSTGDSSKSCTTVESIPIRRPWGQLWLHAAIMSGRDFLYAVEVVLVTPVLLQLGVPEHLYSYIWLCSPTAGLLLGPVFGSLSDRCKSRWGRRRPFVVFFVIITIVALTLLIFSKDLALLFTDSVRELRIIGIVFGVIGSQVMDFCVDQLEGILHAYTLDVCSDLDQQRAFTIQIFFMGLGGSLGFIVDGIKWRDVFQYFTVEFQTKVVYIFAVTIYLGSAAMTLFSIKERSLTRCDTEKTSLVAEMKNERDNNVPLHKLGEKPKSDNEETSASIGKLWSSIFTMPAELRYLCLSLLSSYTGIEVLLLWYTNIFGNVVYGGNATAPVNSTEFKLYNDGVHAGCWGLTMYALSMLLFSVTLEYFDIFSKISQRVVYSGAQLVTAISAAAMFVFPYDYVMYLSSWTIGITVGAAHTLPFILVGKYHRDEKYVTKSPGNTRRGYGIDCAILACQMYAGNIAYALISGPIIAYYGNSRIMMLVASICFTISFILCAIMVKYPGEQSCHLCKMRSTEDDS